MARTRSENYDGIHLGILTNAARLFSAQGYMRASIAELAEACQLSRGALYHYFDSKEAILFAILDAHVRQMIADRSRHGGTVDDSGPLSCGHSCHRRAQCAFIERAAGALGNGTKNSTRRRENLVRLFFGRTNHSHESSNFAPDTDRRRVVGA